MADFMYGPIDTPEPTGFEPLDLDDEDYVDEDDSDGYEVEGEYEDEEYDEEPGLAGFDDLRPFGSFDDGYGWDDSF